ncbi:TolC family protein [Salinicola avicenniae]|uniref:TolC family protein n=1 Tax=Salinicola avicenniae TaxID=2916836 RepID=UPI0020730F98|nr:MULTISPECIES: TolC family protein [unclassified Salinicola]
MRTQLPAVAWQSPDSRANDLDDSRADNLDNDTSTPPVEADPLSLAEAVRRGLMIHPAVRAAIADAESAGTEVDIAEWGYFPEVDLSAGPEEFPFEDLGYDVSARQMLYDWGRVDSRVAQATAAQRETRRALGVAEEEAALDIVEVYLDVLAARRRLAVTRTYVDDLTRLEDLTRDRGSSGYADSSERGRVALDLARAQDDLASARGDIREAESQFRVLVGANADALETPMPAGLTDQLARGDTLADWIVSAPGYRQAVAAAEQAEAELEESRAALKPQLNLEGSLQRRQIGGELENDSVIGFRLRMDTLQGLANFQRPEAARQRLEAARFRIDDQRREIRRTLLTLIENAEVYRDRESALETQREEATAVGDVYDDQFAIGRREVNDLLTIRQQAFTAEQQLVDLDSQQKRIQYRAASQLGLIRPLIIDRLGEGTP